MPRTRRSVSAKGEGAAQLPQTAGTLGSTEASGVETTGAAAEKMGGCQWGTKGPPEEFCSAIAGFKGGSLHLGGAHTQRIFDLAFSPGEGNMLASCSDDDFGAVWEAPKDVQDPRSSVWRQAFALEGHREGVLRISWSQAPGVLATASADSTVGIWRLPQRSSDMLLKLRPVQELKGHPEEVYACEFLQGAGGRRLLSASSSRMFMWDVETASLLQDSDGILPSGSSGRGSSEAPGPDQGYVFGARERPGGGMVAAPCSDGSVRLWAVTGDCSLQALSQVPLHSGMGSSVAFDPEGLLLLSTAGDGSVAVLDLRMWTIAARMQIPAGLMGAAFLPNCSPDGTLSAVMAGQDGNLWCLDLSEGGAIRQLSPLQLSGGAKLAVAVSQDAERIAFGGNVVDVPGGSRVVDEAVGLCPMGTKSVLLTNNVSHQAQTNLSQGARRDVGDEDMG